MIEIAADRVETIDDVLVGDIRRDAARHLRQVSELLSGSHNQKFPTLPREPIELIRMGSFNLFLHSVVSR